MAITYTATYNMDMDFALADLALTTDLEDRLREALDGDRGPEIQAQIEERITAQLRLHGVNTETGEWLGDWDTDGIVRGVLNEEDAARDEPTPTIETVDLDARLAQLGVDPATIRCDASCGRHTGPGLTGPYGDHLIAALAEIQFGDSIPPGVWRRLAATLASIAARRDGNTTLAVGQSAWVEGGREAAQAPMTWSSEGGSWADSRPGVVRQRGWHIAATLVVSVDDDDETRIHLVDPVLVAAGKTGGTTKFAGSCLEQVLIPPLMRAMARVQVRAIMGVGSVDIADEVVDVDDWVRRLDGDKL